MVWWEHIALEEIFEERIGFLTENAEAQLKIFGENKFEEKPGSATVLKISNLHFFYRIIFISSWFVFEAIWRFNCAN